ncbi:phage tail sheath C-terminal domain-containing protein [Actinoplanes sp. NPDC024001]|uniref:phage tail sheath C-terminal domain-containing protein n=1 Tax=Actinoplanes sp. NPDC024001 TaxID=3154598 RepID=UPI00340690D6
MAVTPTYPGVYIEELPSAVRTITTVSTSVTAFVGYTTRGPTGGATTVTSFGDFERQFGGLTADSPLSYAVQQFFLNGGGIAVIVRLAPGAEGSTATLSSGGTQLFTLTAREPGDWGDNLRVSVDHGADADTFDLRIADLSGERSETHTGLTPATAVDRINSASTLVSAAAPAGAPDDTRPDASGTVSDQFDALPDVSDTEIEAAVEERDESTITFPLLPQGATGPASLQQLALLLERGLRGNAGGQRAFSGARVRVTGDNRLQVLSGEPDTVIVFPGDGGLGLAGTTNPSGFPFRDGAQGSMPGFADFLGSADEKTGMHALRDVDDVNLLVLPGVSALDNLDQQVAVLAEARVLCESKRMFLIVESPAAWRTLDAARAGLETLDSIRGDHAALYFPHVLLTDPLTGQVREFGPGGAIAGIIARSDGEGVWRAPAGTAARIVGARGLTVRLTDPENGLLNPLGVNCLRMMPVVGPVVWGARTLDGADRLASQWKYVPVRRTALMIEESLYRGTQWVVFEPNDETLWGQIRLNVGAFMHSLFQQGAFQGTSPRQAYLVKCDRDTTTQDDINRGIVNVLVGFAPLKPAEFLIVKITQLAGQVEV